MKRPPVRLCIVAPNAAVTVGWRVLWFVAAVAMAICSLMAPTAPETVAASLRLRRSETNTWPRPIASASGTSRTSSRVDAGAPASV